MDTTVPHPTRSRSADSSRADPQPRLAAGVALAVLAAASTYRTASGHRPVHLGHQRTDAAGVGVIDTVRIARTPGDVFRFWRRLESLQACVNHLVRVQDLGEGRSTWTAAGPAGVEMNWESEIVEEKPNRLLAWRSRPGTGIVNDGSVRFDATDGGRATRLIVQLRYVPPAGPFGDGVARLMWRGPRQMVREALRGVKQLLEAGELAEPGNAIVHGDR